MAGPGHMNALAQFGHTLHAFPQGLHYPRYAVALPRLNNTSGTQREQADHGANLEPTGTTVGEAQDIIVEPILLVPHAFRARLVHGAGDQKEMVSKLHGHVL